MSVEWLPGWAQWTAGFFGLGLLARAAVWTWSCIRRALAALFRRLWLLFAPARWSLTEHAESILVAVDQQVASLHLDESPRLDLFLRYANLGPRTVRFTLTRLEFSAGCRTVGLICGGVKELPSQLGVPRAAQGGCQHVIQLELPVGAAETIRSAVGHVVSPQPVLLRTVVLLHGHVLVDGAGREVQLRVPVEFAVWTEGDDLRPSRSPRDAQLVGVPSD